MGEKSLIKADSLTKIYKKNVTALENFSYIFEENRITGLIGLNGAGKSTLLKILSMQLYPTGGTIEINGEKIDFQNDSEKKIALLKGKIGFVSENAQFNGDLNVSELLQNTCKFYGEVDTKNKTEQNYQRLLKLCSLQDVVDKKIKTLSKGYRQRLSFALALANNPEILILDEPISGLDPVQINEIRCLVNTLKKGRTIILSTHIMQEVTALCDNIIILNKGKMIQSGSEKEILETTGESDIERAFIKLQGNENIGTENSSKEENL